MQIALCTPKGGAGKTTAILTIINALRLYDKSLSISVVDADRGVSGLTTFFDRRRGQGISDPNIRLWSLRRGQSDREIQSTIEDAHHWGEIVLADVQGTSSDLNDYIVSISNLTIIPSRVGMSDFIPAYGFFDPQRTMASQRGSRFNGRTFAPEEAFLSKVREAVSARHGRNGSARVRDPDSTADCL